MSVRLPLKVNGILSWQSSATHNYMYKYELETQYKQAALMTVLMPLDIR